MAQYIPRSKRLKRILLAAMVICGVIVVAIFFIYRQATQSGAKLIAALPKGTDISLGHIHHTVTKDGRNQLTLDAQSVAYKNGKKIAHLEKPKITYYLENDAEIKLSADKGVWKTESNNLEATGNIELYHKQYELKTERVVYDHKHHALSASQPVKIAGNGFDLGADTLQMDISRKIIYLKGNVVGLFYENFNFQPQ